MPIALKLVPEQAETHASKKKKERSKEKDAFLPETAGGAGAPPVPVGANHRILVVDDNLVVLKAFESRLTKLGFRVTALSNAAAVASTVETQNIELLILDINFPSAGVMEWNGFTVLQWMRRFPQLAQIPVVFVTGTDASKYRDLAVSLGATGLFEKPVNFDELLALMLRVLNQTSNSGSAARLGAQPVENPHRGPD